MRHERQTGFAMFDVLVAMLLLAISLTGACLSLVHTMRTTHAALLATRAVDLATDLSEQLRHAGSATQVAALLVAARARIATVLPVAGLEPEQMLRLESLPPPAEAEAAMPSGGAQLVLRWRAAGGPAPHELRLPLSSVPEAAAP